MGYEPVSPLYPSVGGERCYSFFKFLFILVSLCTPALVMVMGKEGVSVKGTLNKKAYELALYLMRSDIKQPLPIHIATVFITTLLCSQYYQTIDGGLFTPLFPDVWDPVTLFGLYVNHCCTHVLYLAPLLQHKDDMHVVLKSSKENHEVQALLWLSNWFDT